MTTRFTSLTGFLLAGGASRRMGRPKETLLLGGETMLDRQLRLLRSVSRSVATVGLRVSAAGPSDLSVVRLPVDSVSFLPDAIRDRGPLAGIYTGLSWTRTEFNLFLGCDLPLIEPRFLRYLSALALRCQADATLPESRDHRFQPLCAIYRRRALKAVQDALERGENKVTSFFPRVRCHVIPWREITRVGFRARIFDNMNTAEDYEEARRSIER